MEEQFQQSNSTTAEDAKRQLTLLEQAITDAEEAKRQFVKENPVGEGDKEERIRLYNRVEKARKALREFKRSNPDIVA